MPETPQCPRCGYDLSGHTASWERSCPVEGQCSECGLRFAWREVLDPQRQAPRWFFEHGRRWRIRRAVVTVVRALLPSRFYKDVQPRHRVATDRLVVLLLGVVIVSQLIVGSVAYVLTDAGTDMSMRIWGGAVKPTDQVLLKQGLLPQINLSAKNWQFFIVDDGIAFGVLVFACALAIHMLIVSRLRPHPVGGRLFLRVLVYGGIPVILVFQVGVISGWLDYYSMQRLPVAKRTSYPTVPADELRWLLRRIRPLLWLFISATWYYYYNNYLNNIVSKRAWIPVVVGSPLLAVLLFAIL